ncbi:MAG TPA: hypothetical protein PKH97_07220 [Tetrasphaera sp.]|uniref:hypothetical protein n=1 Tax=Nostocoides sp. TaxID=1917966 RepID=UPI002BE9D8E2|nr:hypothetical protein [Tetrasphaera sp.]HNQ06958.1 hypothetical protein [Tetrasphaera sp.]
MASKRANLTAVTVGAAGLLLAGGGAIAYAASSDSTPNTTSTSAPSGSTSGSEGGTTGTSAPSGSTSGSEGGTTGKQDFRGMGGHAHTPVTGAELTKVTDAIKAKDSAVTVAGVQKDEDGSYDAFGTKAGAPVRVQVSADLKTITVETGMGRGPGGMGGHAHTPVTGAELTKVTDAIKAKDSAVTVAGVQKDEDGSYDAFGTKAGAPVRVQVSADLKTITVETGMGRGPGGMGGHHGMDGDHGMAGQPGMDGQSGTGQGGVTDPRLPGSTASPTN